MTGVDDERPFDWIQRAACAGQGEFYFKNETGRTKPQGYRRHSLANELCASCKVAEKCLEFALTSPEPVLGIWAGTTQIQREPVRRKLARRRGKGKQ